MTNLTPEEQRVLRKLLAKQKKGKRRRKPAPKRVGSILARDGVAEAVLVLIFVILFLGYITR